MKIKVTDHAIERIRESFEFNAKPFVISRVKDAIEANSFTRSPPEWLKAKRVTGNYTSWRPAKRISKGYDRRYIRTAISDIPTVIVVERRNGMLVVVTVITKTRALSEHA